MSVCKNCGSSIGIFAATAIERNIVDKYKEVIQCPDHLCTKCHGPYTDEFNLIRQGDISTPEMALNREEAMTIIREREQTISKFRVKEQAIPKIRIVSVHVLPANTRYRLIDLVSFQSTLGTGLFSEFGSNLSNIFGTEANMLNAKMSESVNKCKDAMRALAYDLGANAVIGVNFDFNSNSKDATTVAAQGTAVFIENIEEIFLMS